MYQQVSIAETLKEHSSEIDCLRQRCANEIALDPTQFNDDLFLLRFCLSHKTDVDKRVAALKTACEFRHQHREVLAKIKAGTRHPDVAELCKYSPFDLHGALNDGSPIFIVRQGVGNMALLMEKVPPERIKNGVLFQKEEAHLLCDAESRKRGKIVKMVSISDMQGFGWSSFNRGFMSILGEAIKETELVWPQLLGNSIISHPPGFFRVVMSVAQLILPQSTLEKMKVCRGYLGDDIAKCPVASKVIDVASLPTFLGGKCTCASRGGCVSGIPNSYGGQVTGNEADRLSEMKMAKATARITLKAKDYCFRVRSVLNSSPMMPADKAGSSDANDEFLLAKQPKTKLESELIVADLGPFLIPLDDKGKPTTTEAEFKETLVFILDIQKLTDAVHGDVSKGISEKKEKRVEVEVHPFQKVSKKVDFGDTAELDFTMEPVSITVGSPALAAAAAAAAAAASSSASAAAAAPAAAAFE